MSWEKNILHKKDSGTVSGLDAGIKKPWNWSWLDKQVDGCPLSEFMFKHRDPGKAICRLCDGKVISYSRGGWCSLKQHCSGSKHVKRKRQRELLDKLPEEKSFRKRKRLGNLHLREEQKAQETTTSATRRLKKYFSMGSTQTETTSDIEWRVKEDGTSESRGAGMAQEDVPEASGQSEIDTESRIRKHDGLSDLHLRKEQKAKETTTGMAQEDVPEASAQSEIDTEDESDLLGEGEEKPQSAATPKRLSVEMMNGKRSVTASDKESEILEQLLSLLKQHTNSAPRPRPSEDELFLKSLVPSLQQVPPQHKERVKFEIHKLIYEATLPTVTNGMSG
ncbi:uncharacterized protein LOC144021230 [Festucalex cinctus]